MRRLIVLFALVLWLPRSALATGLSASDIAAVRAITQEYRDGWLANDPERVMATLTPDAVLVPSGLMPIAGHASIRRFWWPATGPPTRVTTMDLNIEEIDGRDDLAIVRGLGSLTFVAGSSSPTSLRSTFLNIVRRQTDGRWLIARRIGSDLR
jgi:uncharacterized protein (TIGR02246 family)